MAAAVTAVQSAGSVPASRSVPASAAPSSAALSVGESASRAAVRNSYSYLKTGGVFRLVLPDLKQMAREYVIKFFDRNQQALQFGELIQQVGKKRAA